MIKPKNITLTDQDGEEHHFIIGKMPYMSGGREVCSQYITTAAPKLGDYEQNEKLAVKLLSYVSVVLEDGRDVPLSTRQLIDNHIPDFITGIKLEEAALSHNMGFSLAGKIQQYQEDFFSQVKQWITKIWTQSPPLSSGNDSPPLRNSEQSIP